MDENGTNRELANQNPPKPSRMRQQLNQNAFQCGVPANPVEAAGSMMNS
jgi:hypothetical protein